MDLIKKILTNTANADEIYQHEQLLSNLDYKQEFEAYEKIWDRSSGTFSEFNKDTAEAWEKVSAETINNSGKVVVMPRRKFAVSIKWAAAIIVLFTCAFLFKQFNTTEGVALSYYSANEVKEVKLADGSEVWLNRNSSVEVLEGFNNEQRKVILKGEAFFDIAKNLEKPFLIECNNTVTKVLGTSFNIYSNRESARVEINVASGLVSFKSRSSLFGGEERMLTAGESCVYNNDTRELNKRTETENNYLSWKTKNIKFDDTNIEEVCRVLSHDFNTIVVCKGDNINEVSFTASFKNEELSSILEVISLSINADIVEEESKIVLLLQQ